MNMPESEDYDYVKPKHYRLWKGMQTFELHRSLLTEEEFIGYCKGNIIKYQMRMGKKPGESVEREISKIETYNEILNEILNE